MEYKCDTCIKTFPNMRGLQMHWRKGIHLKVSAAVAKTNSETFSSSADASSLKKKKAECSHRRRAKKENLVVQYAMT